MSSGRGMLSRGQVILVLNNQLSSGADSVTGGQGVIATNPACSNQIQIF